MTTSKQVQRRRGTSSQCDAMIPAIGEVVIDTTNLRQRIGDGVTLGGIIVPNVYDVQLRPFINGTVGGSANAITITLSPPLTSYTNFQTVRFRATATNTGAATINIDGNGDLDIVKIKGGVSQNIDAGNILLDGIYEGVVNGGEFQLLTLIEEGLVSVSQGDLNTSTGSVSGGSVLPNVPRVLAFDVDASGGSSTVSLGAYMTSGRMDSGSGTRATLPGGQYGFFPRWSRSFSSPNNNYTLSQTYILSSPPYDLGEGEVAGFFFALVDDEGKIRAHYLADTPPWAYNGPTDIMCTHKCSITGKKYRKITKNRSLEQIMDGMPLKYEMQEITHEIKNADMHLFPTPFSGDLQGLTPLLFDPTDERVRKLIDIQNSNGTEEVMEAILSGKFVADNELLKRKGPPGVAIHKMKYKFDRKF